MVFGLNYHFLKQSLDTIKELGGRRNPCQCAMSIRLFSENKPKHIQFTDINSVTEYQ